MSYIISLQFSPLSAMNGLDDLRGESCGGNFSVRVTERLLSMDIKLGDSAVYRYLSLPGDFH